MRKSELFEAFDLFDVRDFGKVMIVCFLINSLNIVLGSNQSLTYDRQMFHYEATQP